jgi:hypothetical protein
MALMAHPAFSRTSMARTLRIRTNGANPAPEGPATRASPPRLHGANPAHTHQWRHPTPNNTPGHSWHGPSRPTSMARTLHIRTNGATPPPGGSANAGAEGDAGRARRGAGRARGRERG